jgi:dihydroneopterin aldolase
MSSDRIRLANIIFYGHHGVDEAERAMGRRFAVDVELELDLRAAAAEDDLARTADYAAVYRLVREVGTASRFSLVETLAERIAQRVLAEHEQVRSVTVRARKQEPPVGGLMDHVEVELTRDRGH